VKPETRARLETWGLLRPKDAGPPFPWWVAAGLAAVCFVAASLVFVLPAESPEGDRVVGFVLIGLGVVHALLASRLRRKGVTTFAKDAGGYAVALLAVPAFLIAKGILGLIFGD
jgi:hypothetical protein